MTYPINVNIPAAGNDPADDQPLMQTNFSNINSYLQVDHTNPAATGAGEHKQVTFNSNNVPTPPVSPPVLFTNNDAFAIPQLFYYTNDASHSSSQYSAASVGSTMMLGGMIIKWGNLNANNPGVATSFGAAFPNNCFAVNVTSTNLSYHDSLTVTAITKTGFTCTRTAGSGNTGALYIAIGN